MFFPAHLFVQGPVSFVNFSKHPGKPLFNDDCKDTIKQHKKAE
jgi:hypothetical protein